MLPEVKLEPDGKPKPLYNFKVFLLPKTQLLNYSEQRSEVFIKRYLHILADYNGKKNHILLSNNQYLQPKTTVFIKVRQKHNRTYKQVCTHQHFADIIKPYFELKQIGTALIYLPTEGYGVLQKWHRYIATVKNRTYIKYWMSEDKLIELFKICLFDGIIGSLDRHGNNIIVDTNKNLITIDDEDLFYNNSRNWIKLDTDIRHTTYLYANQHRNELKKYTNRIKTRQKTITNLAKQHLDPQYYELIKNNLNNLDWFYEETFNQLKR